LEADKM